MRDKLSYGNTQNVLKEQHHFLELKEDIGAYFCKVKIRWRGAVSLAKNLLSV